MKKYELLLIHLNEELGEMQKEVSKALRFGLGNYNPSTKESNFDAICREFTDVVAVADELSQECNILIAPNDKTSDNYISKRQRISTYLLYSIELGILEKEDKYDKPF